MTTSSPLVVALDFPEAKPALDFVDRIKPDQCRLKIGKELFTAAGPEIVQQCQKRGFEVFLDLKFHDIPNTVHGAVKAAIGLGVWMVNVHASGGPKMLEAAADAVAQSNAAEPTLLIAVTVLTTIDAGQWAQIGHPESIEASVDHFATMSQQAGCAGVVCSAQEAGRIKTLCGQDFKTVTPGIRLANPATAVQKDDQSRIMTPERAVAAGSDYLVMGRPITQSQNPIDTLDQINRSLQTSRSRNP